MTYHCALCRPKTKHLGIYSSLKTSVITKLSIKKAITGSSSSSNPANSNSNRKTKTLHNLKSQKLTKQALKEQKRAELEAMPLVPHNAMSDELGRVTIDLNLLKQRLRCDDTIRERLHLTDSGLKQIKAQVIRAPHVRSVGRKGRKKDDIKGVPGVVMSEDVTCSVDSADDIGGTLGLDKIDNSFEVEQDVLSPDIKTEDGLDMDLLQPDTTAETDDLLDETQEDISAAPDPGDTTDPV